MSKNVLIPYSTFENIINMMECLDFAGLPNHYDHLDILRELKIKKQKLDIRESYSKVIHAEDEDDRNDLRIEYLRQKRRLEGY